MGRTHKSETASAPRRTKKRYQEFQPSKDLIQLSEAMKRKREYELDALTKQEAIPINQLKISWKMRYALYVARWGVLAVPGTWFLIFIQWLFPMLGLSKAMVISQILLGCFIFFVDKKIFRG